MMPFRKSARTYILRYWRDGGNTGSNVPAQTVTSNDMREGGR